METIPVGSSPFFLLFVINSLCLRGTYRMELKMRLDKYLADMGVGKRSDIKKNIHAGKVQVAGEIIKDPGFNIPEADAVSTGNPAGNGTAGSTGNAAGNSAGKPEVLYLGEPVQYEAFEYYMLNKPAGVISASEDKHQVTVLDLMKERKRSDLYPVGRLDKDTEGLLLITNDGELTHRLLSPKHHTDKVYFARVSGRVTANDVKRFRHGIRYDEDLTALPAVLTILSSGDVSEVETTIQEGKFHQIKKMFLALGKEVLYLKRLSMGPVRLDETLAPGEYRRLTEAEINALKEL